MADGALAVLMSLITPLVEKNPAKALATPGSAFVFSMSRVIVLAFAGAMRRQMWHTGVGGWPDATLSIAIVRGETDNAEQQELRPHDRLLLQSSPANYSARGLVVQGLELVSPDRDRPQRFSVTECGFAKRPSLTRLASSLL